MQRPSLAENQHRQLARARPTLLQWPVISLPVVALLALASPAVADDAVRSDTVAKSHAVSANSIKETVRALLARSVMASRDPDPEVSAAAGGLGIAQAVNIKPPRGASFHQRGVEASLVEATTVNRSLTARKGTPERRGDVGTAPALPPAVETAQQIGFSSASRTPGRGIDERLQRAAEAGQGQDETYAFLLLNERLSPEIERDLEFSGVTVLGPHGDAFKVRVPLSRDDLEAVAGKPYVHSLSYSLPEQKLSTGLSQSAATSAGAVELFPVIINLFEEDPQGAFIDRLTGLGVQVGQYDPALKAYTALVPAGSLRALTDLDFVLFIELEGSSGSGHDQSMATNGVDYIRAAGFNGAPITLGILDTGFMLGTAAATQHQDLSKNGCGINFTTDAAGVWNDQNGHGTHVLATITGTGTANSRYRGVAPGLGTQNRIRAAKIWGSAGTGQNAWLRDAMDYMGNATSCDAPRPQVLNISGGSSGTNLTGTDSESRKLDSKV
jgi:hypothetical protein